MMITMVVNMMEIVVRMRIGVCYCGSVCISWCALSGSVDEKKRGALLCSLGVAVVR